MSQQVQNSSPAMDDLDVMERQMAARWRWVWVALLVLAGLLGGVAISRAAAPRPKIGVMYLYDVIDYTTYQYYFGPLQEAADRRDVAALVIYVDSPGGYATISEELFYTIRKLRDQKPVVASIEGIGASGAYYASSAANYIIARPAADVGSIGVISSGLPEDVPPDEESYATGPFKGSGSSRTEYIRDIEMIKQVFLGHVYDERKYALEHMHNPSRADVLPAREMIATGQVWVGSHAYEIGLVDALGSNQDALEKAAQLAGISNYEVLDLLNVYLEESGQLSEAAPDQSQERTTQFVSPLDRIYRMFYVAPER